MGAAYILLSVLTPTGKWFPAPWGRGTMTTLTISEGGKFFFVFEERLLRLVPDLLQGGVGLKQEDQQ